MTRLKSLTYKERSEQSPLKDSNILLRIIFETDVLIYESLINGGAPRFREKTIDFLTHLLNTTEDVVMIFPRSGMKIRDGCFYLLNLVGDYWKKGRKEGS